MESGDELPKRFKKLVILIKLILRAYSRKCHYFHKSREILPSQSPTKSPGRSHALSLHQMSQPGLLQSISHKIQQRLQRQSTPSPAAVQIMHPVQYLEPEAQRILTNSSWTRNSLELNLVFEKLQTYEAFMDYPPDLQMSLCKVAHYQRLEEGRVVFCEGRQPASFYLILSGRVQLVKKTREGSCEILQTLATGESFGAEAIIEKELRSASCFVKDTTELLVISKSALDADNTKTNNVDCVDYNQSIIRLETAVKMKQLSVEITVCQWRSLSGWRQTLRCSKHTEDYLDLSLRQSSFRYQKVKHFLFCRMIPVLKPWPISELEEHPDLCIVQYFKPNAVVTIDSRKCEWIYVIMSGTCRVVKKFKELVDSKSSEPSTHSTRRAKGKHVLFPDLPEPKAGLAQSRMAHHKPGMSTSVSSGELGSQNLRRTVPLRPSMTTTNLHHSEGSKVPHPVRKQFLIQLQILHPKDIFGLSSIAHDAEPPITLVSNGAEVIMISKEFIKRHLTDSLKAKLQRQVMEYPSEEAMMKRIKDHHTWNSFK